MSQYGKQPLTAEEVVARKGDVAPDAMGSPRTGAPITDSAHRSTLPINDLRPIAGSERALPDRESRA